MCFLSFFEQGSAEHYIVCVVTWLLPKSHHEINHQNIPVYSVHHIVAKSGHHLPCPPWPLCFSTLHHIPHVFPSFLTLPALAYCKRAPLFNISCLDRGQSGTYTGRWFTPESQQLIFECLNVCAPSLATQCANLDILLRVIQIFLGLGGAALWSLLQLSSTMLKRLKRTLSL